MDSRMADEINRRVTSAAFYAWETASLNEAALLWRSPLLFRYITSRGGTNTCMDRRP
jgi:hypothetical protein